MRRLAICCLGILLMPFLTLSASEITTNNSQSDDQKIYHTTYPKCPDDNHTCGWWYYGRYLGTSKDQFKANDNYLSGYGSQVTMLVEGTSVNYYLKDYDTSTGKDSYASVSTNEPVLHYYYDYYGSKN